MLIIIDFNGNCSVNDIYTTKKLINIYIYYILSPWLKNLNTDFTLKNCLFGSVKLTKNADPNKYKYSSYRIGFGSCWKFLFTEWSIRKNIIFGADMSWSAHIDSEFKDILVLGKGPKQGLEDTTLIAEAIYPINFMQPDKRFVLSLHYNGSNSFVFVNARNIHQLNAKDWNKRLCTVFR